MAGVSPLGPGDLPRVLRDAAAEARTGRLEVVELGAAARVRRGLHFEAGHLMLASSSVSSERLGETLVRSGRLGLFDLVRATTIVAREHRRLGQVLRELGLIDAASLREALAGQARDLLQRALLSPGQGCSWASAESTGEPPLPTSALFHDAAGGAADGAAMLHAIGGAERVLRRSNPPRVLSAVALGPLQQRLLRQLDLAPASPRGLAKGASASELEVQRALVGLLCLGQVS